MTSPRGSGRASQPSVMFHQNSPTDNINSVPPNPPHPSSTSKCKAGGKQLRTFYTATTGSTIIFLISMCFSFLHCRTLICLGRPAARPGWMVSPVMAQSLQSVPAPSRGQSPPGCSTASRTCGRKPGSASRAER